MNRAIFESNLKSLPLLGRGKVRDIYEADDDYLLIVATDRLSAFDVVLPQAIPGKGRVLTEVSRFWFSYLQHVIPNHLSSRPLSDYLTDSEIEELDGRAMLVHKLKPLPIEAVVRGYLIGSGWKDYLKTGAVCGIVLPQGLQQAQQLPEALFTPATKAAAGDHDENISFARTVDLVGRDLADHVKQVSLALYTEAASYARQRGIIIADTKFEFGLDANNRLVLIDEVLTPDSSRFWPADQYRPGISPPSFDKQFVRDYLETLDWDKTPPGPQLPEEIIRNTGSKYQEALQRLTQP
ncbi:MAG: phosphoribosylaminoimidazolesuccinocarboxamide synthase [Gammaproteobacteria bacterium]|nr:phosphoribosylaminoimidazolesuccinocarboxamide synthase [Gammaproteobacteria bacterium]